MQLSRQRIGAHRHLPALVVHAQQVPAPAGKHQRDIHQAGQIQVEPLLIPLQGAAVAYGDLLRTVGSNALWGIGYGRIGEALVQHLVDEGPGAEDTRVLHHRQALGGDVLHQGLQVGVPHLGGNGGVTQQAAEHRQGGMKRIEAGTHLHLLRLLHGGPVGEVHPRPLQGRPSIGEGILQHQILGDLRVDKGSDECAGVGLADGHVRQAQALQLLLYLLGGMGGDLVDHGPGEGHLTSVGQPGQEVLRYQASLQPSGGDALHRILELLTVLGAVVHTYHGDGGSPRLESPVEQGGGDGHGVSGTVGAALQVPLHHRLQITLKPGEGVTLLGNGKAGHLQSRRLEYLHQPVPVGTLAVGLQTPRHAADHLHLIGAVGRHAD